MLHEIAVEKRRVIGGQLGGGQHQQPGLGQQAPQFVEGGLLGVDQFARAQLDGVELLGRGEPIGGGLGDAGPRLADQPGHAHGIELVEIGGADGDEAQAFQERVAGVARLAHHPEIEIQPG